MASGSAQLHQQVQLTSTPVQTYLSGNTVVNGNSFSSLAKPIVVPPGTMVTGDKSPVIRNVKRRKGEDDEYHVCLLFFRQKLSFFLIFFIFFIIFIFCFFYLFSN